MAETCKKSSSHERRVVGYLKPGNKAFVKSYVQQCETTESKVINEAVQALKEKVTMKQKHD